MYRLGYYNVDGGANDVLLHENKFTHEQFSDLIAYTFIDLAIKWAKEMFGYKEEFLDEAKEGKYIVGSDYGTSSHKVIECLIEKHGFVRPDYVFEHFVSGDACLLNSYKKLTSEELNIHVKFQKRWMEEFGWLPKERES